MKKFLIYSIYGFAFLCVPAAVHAMVISEIYYDPEGSDATHEWIEVHNDGSESVDLAGWRLFENSVNHTLSAVVGGSVIAPGQYAVIADNASVVTSDFPDIGIVFDSAFSLNNTTGETIALKDASLAVVDSASYTSALGAAGDGASLNFVASSWVARMPSPGFPPNTSSVQIDDDPDEYSEAEEEDNNTTDESSVSAVQEDNNNKKKDPVYTLSLKTPEVVTAHSPAIFEGVLKRDKEELMSGRFILNMGDGKVFNIEKLKRFEYTYQHAGNYPIVFEYYKNYFDEEPFLRVTKKLSVLAGNIAIETISSDGLITVFNNDTKDIDISGWQLMTKDSNFRFGKNTVLLAGQASHIPYSVHNLMVSDRSAVTLQTPTGIVVASYPQRQMGSYAVSESSSSLDASTDASRVIMNGQEASAVKSVSLRGIVPWLVGLLGLVLVVVMGLIAAMRGSRVHNEIKGTQHKIRDFSRDDIELLH